MSLFALILTFIILPVWMSNLKNNFTQGSSIIFEEYFFDQGFHHVTLAEDVDITGKQYYTRNVDIGNVHDVWIVILVFMWLPVLFVTIEAGVLIWALIYYSKICIFRNAVWLRVDFIDVLTVRAPLVKLHNYSLCRQMCYPYQF